MDWERERERERERLREVDNDKIKEADGEDTNRLRRSIMTVVSEPDPTADVPLETDVDATLEFAPVFRASEELTTRSDALEVKKDVDDAAEKVEEKEKEAEIFVRRRRDSQGSQILQTPFAAEAVTVFSQQAQPGTLQAS